MVGRELFLVRRQLFRGELLNLGVNQHSWLKKIKLNFGSIDYCSIVLVQKDGDLP